MVPFVGPWYEFTACTMLSPALAIGRLPGLGAWRSVRPAPGGRSRNARRSRRLRWSPRPTRRSYRVPSASTQCWQRGDGSCAWDWAVYRTVSEPDERKNFTRDFSRNNVTIRWEQPGKTGRKSQKNGRMNTFQPVCLLLSTRCVLSINVLKLTSYFRRCLSLCRI